MDPSIHRGTLLSCPNSVQILDWTEMKAIFRAHILHSLIGGAWVETWTTTRSEMYCRCRQLLNPFLLFPPFQVSNLGNSEIHYSAISIQFLTHCLTNSIQIHCSCCCSIIFNQSLDNFRWQSLSALRWPSSNHQYHHRQSHSSSIAQLSSHADWPKFYLDFQWTSPISNFCAPTHPSLLRLLLLVLPFHCQ